MVKKPYNFCGAPLDPVEDTTGMIVFDKPIHERDMARLRRAFANQRKFARSIPPASDKGETIFS